MDITSKLKAYREIEGLTQKELADKIGVGKGTISKIENGHSISTKVEEQVEEFFIKLTSKKVKRRASSKKKTTPVVIKKAKVPDTSFTCKVGRSKPPIAKPTKKKVLAKSTEEIDVVISFDTTGSMYPCLSQTRREISNMITSLFNDIPNIRIGIIAHGDYCDAHDPYTIIMMDLTDDKKTLVNFVEGVKPTYGGDFPECYELVLREARGFSWRAGKSKVLVMVGDATPHEKSYPGNTDNIDWRNELGLLAEASIQVYAVHALAEYRQCSKKFYQTVADKTGGFYLVLNQFAYMVNMIKAICYKQQGDSYLEQFEAKLIAKRMLNRNMDSIVGTMLGRKISRFKSDAGGLGAVSPGRFQIMDVDYDCPIKVFVESQGCTFKKGRGFYEFGKKRVKVQDYKEVILEHNETGDLFTGAKAREMLGLPNHGTAALAPTKIHLDEYTVFIQSTSYNRKLLGGDRFLYEVEEWDRTE